MTRSDWSNRIFSGTSQIIRYLFFGGLTALVFTAVSLTLESIGVSQAVSVSGAFWTSAILGYYLQARYTFRIPISSLTFVRFASVAVFSWWFSLLMSYTLNLVLDSRVMVLILVSGAMPLFNFFLHKLITFKTSAGDSKN
jgi:putative flippase GtrA